MLGVVCEDTLFFSPGGVSSTYSGRGGSFEASCFAFFSLVFDVTCMVGVAPDSCFFMANFCVFSAFRRSFSTKEKNVNDCVKHSQILWYPYALSHSSHACWFLCLQRHCRLGDAVRPALRTFKIGRSSVSPVFSPSGVKTLVDEMDNE
jgi:hypothetical protein